MKRKAVIGILIFVLLLSFLLGNAGAFRLADGSSTATANKDKLVGVFVTYDYLNTFDNDAYLNDNIDKILSGKEINSNDTSKYNSRLYAAIVDKELVNESTGEKSSIKEYVFEGIDGILYYMITETDEAGNQMSSSGGDCDAITDGHVNFAVTDDSESVYMKGTIYASVINGSRVFYINPVYQTENGELYALAGNGMSQSGDLFEGMNHSIELKDETAEKINGKISSYSSRVDVTVNFMHPPEKIVIIQMDDDSKVLCREEYVPGFLPNEIKANANSGYIIIES